MTDDTATWDEAFRRATSGGFDEWIDWTVGFVAYDTTKTLAKVNDTLTVGVVVRPLDVTENPDSFRCRMETTRMGGNGRADCLLVEASPTAASLARFKRLVRAWCLDARGVDGMIGMTAKAGTVVPRAA